MAKKLALALIAAGAIGTFAGVLNLRNATDNYRKIKEEILYNNPSETKTSIEIERNPKVIRNAMYAGFSAAITLASVLAIGTGAYLQIGKDYFKKRD
jgi:hypothetical protein